MPTNATGLRRQLRDALAARVAALPDGDPLKKTIVTSRALTLEAPGEQAIGLGDWRTFTRDPGPMRGPATRKVDEAGRQEGRIGVTTGGTDQDDLDELENLAWGMVELIEDTLQEGAGIFGYDEAQRPAVLGSLTEERGDLVDGGQYVQIDFAVHYDARL